MKLSIIIPVYKAENYISDTLKSVLGQTFSDFELILVDDGSPDRSGEICDEFAKTDSRIRVIHKENGGVSSARNVGVKEAKGEYIGFVDSDDLISPVMYEGLMHEAEAECADIVQCTHNREVHTLDKSSEAKGKKVFSTVDALKYLYIGYYTNNFSLCSKVWRRSLFDGITFPLGRVFEDDEVIPHLIAKCNVMVSVDNEWYCYVKRENSIITGVSFDGICALTQTLHDRVAFFSTIDKELCDMAAAHFKHYLKMKFVNCYKNAEGLSPNEASYFRSFLLKNSFKKTKFEKIYFTLLKVNILNKWIGENDFEPIEAFIGKLMKRIKR